MSGIYSADASSPDRAQASIRARAEAYVASMEESAERVDLVSEGVDRRPNRVVGEVVELLLGIVGAESVFVLKQERKITFELDLDFSDSGACGFHEPEHTDNG